MQLSVVICTRNRAFQLADTLRTLTTLQCPVPWELVLVDNGSTDKTQDVIKSYADKLSLKTFIEPQAGLSRARNKGWALSRGDVVAFTDDDCYPADDFLFSILRCFAEQAGLGFIGGRILRYDSKDYRITIQERSERRDLSPGNFLPDGLIHGANFAFRRTALESVNGFDERFGAGALFSCAEDVDILARMLARGWNGAYDPRPLVYHHHRRRTEAEALRLMKQYDRGRGAYYLKCILDLDPKLRALYLLKWCRAMLRQPWRRTARELAAATEFLVLSVKAQLFQPGGASRE